MKLRLLPSAKKKMEEQKKKAQEKTSKMSRIPDEYREEIPTKFMSIGDGDSRLVFTVQRQGEFGLPHLDIRKFVKTPKYEGPTKSGINIPLESLVEMLDILNHIKDECEAKKLTVDYNEPD